MSATTEADRRDEPPVPHDDAGAEAVVLFDGSCNLCNRTIQFIVRRDRRGVFRCAALDSDAARRLLHAAGVSDSPPDSMVLIEAGQAYSRSTAVLRMLRRLRLPWRLLYAFIVVPRPIRNWVYDFVAARRYRWFGRRERV